jgi:uncharacterized surface protein with fasciclin (FAS1) repeats
MASLHGYFEWYDLAKGFNNIGDYRGSQYGYNTRPSSLTTALDSNNFKYYRYLVEKANLLGRFDDPQARFTIFAPSDDTLDDETKRIITNADINLAKNLINFSTIPRVIRSETLNESGVYWMDTRNSPERILVDSRPGNGVLLSGHRLLGAKLELGNGVLYQIQGLLIPTCVL